MYQIVVECWYKGSIILTSWGAHKGEQVSHCFLQIFSVHKTEYILMTWNEKLFERFLFIMNNA